MTVTTVAGFSVQRVSGLGSRLTCRRAGRVHVCRWPRAHFDADGANLTVRLHAYAAHGATGVLTVSVRRAGHKPTPVAKRARWRPTQHYRLLSA